MTASDVAINLEPEFDRRGYNTDGFEGWVEEILFELAAAGEVMWFEEGYRVPSTLEKIALAASASPDAPGPGSP